MALAGFSFYTFFTGPTRLYYAKEHAYAREPNHNYSKEHAYTGPIYKLSRLLLPLPFTASAAVIFLLIVSYSVRIIDERLVASSNKSLVFGKCYLKGDVRIELWHTLPDFLFRLLTNNDPRSSQFCKKLREYNNLFAFTSVKVNET
ncbi:hypothetical protein BT67DRAFT_432355 [Trichocladium antarcticum]|uniref:Uncharacterized protein n=1 Tax=Trichocladium antarcticum TaxID=1450529 RepID=A0AAN6ZG21_9PEZI|nr:hypothetical protein BT67DRAFT_432355 [Trichocladium antarcticum]